MSIGLVVYIVLAIATGSIVAAFGLWVGLVVIALAATWAARESGVTTENPWLVRLASRPWRSGLDVFRDALRRLDNALLPGIRGITFAPVQIELVLSPRDLASLYQAIEPQLAMQLASEAYAEVIRTSAATLSGRGLPTVVITSSAEVAPGRFTIRSARVAARPAPPPYGNPVHDGTTRIAPVGGVTHPAQEHDDRTVVEAGDTAPTNNSATVQLRRAGIWLNTDGSIFAGPRDRFEAGRGADCDLRLPAAPTVSRRHAVFDWDGAAWMVTNVGRNGLLLNGSAVDQTERLHDGDLLRWGTRNTAPTSTVHIE